MNSLSVVIITYNEEHNIADCIRSAKLVSDDIIVVDCASSDKTVAIAQNEGAATYIIDWRGYGYSKNFGATKAKFNWILSIDADERIGVELAEFIRKQNFTDGNYIYKFKRNNYISGNKIHFGTLGFEMIERIYHRQYTRWDLSLVHEKLIGKRPIKKTIGGHLRHFGLQSVADHRQKAVLYARLSAEKYFAQGKRTHFIQRHASAIFNSVKSYIFLLGFMDGRQGFFIAKGIAYYSWLKYFYLYQLQKQSCPNEVAIHKQSVIIKAVSN
jgi:glycosyltransferase involved in cell wall biosynthesis